MLILPHIVEKAQQLARSKGKSFQPETAWSSFSCRISLHDDGVWPSESRSLGTTILTLVQLRPVFPLFNQTMTNNLMLRQKQNDWTWITQWMLKYRCKEMQKTTIHFYPSLDFSGLRGKKEGSSCICWWFPGCINLNMWVRTRYMCPKIENPWLKGHQDDTVNS